jgi:nitrite reductase/ring-hydroxylating ferredoxin subunit
MTEPVRQLDDEQFQAALQRLDALVQEFERLPLPAIQEKIFEMLQTVDAVHREGLQRLISLLPVEGRSDWLEQAATDPAVRALLLFYDLAPPAVAASLPPEPPLAANAPSAGAPPNGTPPANRGPAASYIALDRVQLFQAEGAARDRRLETPALQPVARLDELPPGATLAVAVAELRVLLANIEGELFAVGELCPGSDMPLSFGALEGHRLICAWHNEVYDIRNGRCLDPAGRDDDPRLPVYPVSVEQGDIRLALAGAGQPPSPQEGNQ